MLHEWFVIPMHDRHATLFHSPTFLQHVFYSESKISYAAGTLDTSDNTEPHLLGVDAFEALLLCFVMCCFLFLFEEFLGFLVREKSINVPTWRSSGVGGKPSAAIALLYY